MKTALIRSKDQMQNLMDDGQVSPSEYAEDKLRYAAEDVADRVGHDVSSGAKKAVNKGKEAYREHREESAFRRMKNVSENTRKNCEDLHRLPLRSRTRQEIPQRRMSRRKEQIPISSVIRRSKLRNVLSTPSSSLPVLRVNRL